MIKLVIHHLVSRHAKENVTHHLKDKHDKIVAVPDMTKDLKCEIPE